MKPVRKFNTYNHLPNLPNKGLGDLIAKNPDAASAGGNFLGDSIMAVDGADGKTSYAGSALGGAAKGAAAGLALGPIGAIVGGALGGIAGIFTQRAKERKAKREAAAAEANRVEMQTSANNNASLAILRNFPTTGVDRPRMEQGGMVNKALGSKIAPVQAEYLAEDGEVIQHDPNAVPATDQFGKLTKLASDTSLIKGAKHSDPSQGVGMTGGERIFSDNPSLKIPKDFSKLLKKL
jgi:hypothetical protein